MLPAVVISLSILGIVGFVMANVWYSHRQWVAVWRGHKVLVRMHHAKIFVELDQQPIFEQPYGFIKTKYQQEWTHPALGATMIHLQKVVEGSDGEGLRLRIGEELIPLIEVERKWYGGLEDGAADTYWEKLIPAQVESLGDPRWVAACKILDLVRQSTMATQAVREAANILQVELRKRFEQRRRLAEESLEVVDAETDTAALQQQLEANILHALEAVKSLHMAVVSIEAQADERSEMQKVETIIESLQAVQEVGHLLEQPVSDTIELSKKQKSKRRTEGKTSS